jgi:hypothetical protein
MIIRPFSLFSQVGTGFVTRIKDNAAYETIVDCELDDSIHSGVEKDEIIEIQVKEEGATKPLKLRKVQFYDRVLKDASNF